MRRLPLLLLSILATVAAAQTGPDLPDIGNPAGAVLSEGEEYRIGAMIVRQLRDQNVIIEDPEVAEYLQTTGMKLASQAPDDAGRNFQFFGVREGTINAFALPGGFIGVNYGLILATNNESELASVLAHEIAHVTQRHIARTVRKQSQQSIANTAAILAPVLIGAISGSGDVMQGAIAAAQGIAAQQQINFTRAHEYEADRVGIGYMVGAGFDPHAMPSFFETMGRRTGLAASYVPEMIQTHPVTTNRIAESRNRAEQFPRVEAKDSDGYKLIRERLRVITAPRDQNLVAEYEARLRTESDLGTRYGYALALMAANRPLDAARILQELLNEHEKLTLLHSALGQAQSEAGLTNDGLATFQRAMQLFPRNVPLTVRYAEALMRANRHKEAHAVLLDLFNNVPPTPEQIRLTALAASAAGDTGDAYFYMGEYHIASGDLALAAQQFELALAAPNLNPVQRQRFKARLEEVREYLANVKVRRASRRSE